LKSVTGGAVDFSSDPKLDPYLSWVGQVQSALASFNIQGQRGGIQLLNYLKDHFPNYADSPADALRKAQILRKNSSVIQRRIDQITGQITGAAKIATDSGGDAVQGWVKMRVRNKKTGQEQDLWYDPSSGDTSATNPSTP
jgi:hypothetical protein